MNKTFIQRTNVKLPLISNAGSYEVELGLASLDVQTGYILSEISQSTQIVEFDPQKILSKTDQKINNNKSLVKSMYLHYKHIKTQLFG